MLKAVCAICCCLVTFSDAFYLFGADPHAVPLFFRDRSRPEHRQEVAMESRIDDDGLDLDEVTTEADEVNELGMRFVKVPLIMVEDITRNLTGQNKEESLDELKLRIEMREREIEEKLKEIKKELESEITTENFGQKTMESYSDMFRENEFEKFTENPRENEIYDFSKEIRNLQTENSINSENGIFETTSENFQTTIVISQNTNENFQTTNEMYETTNENAQTTNEILPTTIDNFQTESSPTEKFYVTESFENLMDEIEGRSESDYATTESPKTTETDVLTTILPKLDLRRVQEFDEEQQNYAQLAQLQVQNELNELDNVLNSSSDESSASSDYSNEDYQRSIKVMTTTTAFANEDATTEKENRETIEPQITTTSSVDQSIKSNNLESDSKTVRSSKGFQEIASDILKALWIF